MNKQKTIIENKICEALGCSDNAAFTIAIPVGEKGSILLFVCENCIEKFQKQELTA